MYDIAQMCVPNSPLFQRRQVYDKPTFLKRKYMNALNFWAFVWPKFFDIHLYSHIVLRYSSSLRFHINIKQGFS